jgi:hypothetical protein
MVEWSPEQEARFPFETRVLLDVYLARGAVKVMEDEAPDQSAVRPYLMETRDGSLFGLGLAPDFATVIAESLTMMGLDRTLRMMAHRDCPLYDCEEREHVQRAVPRHNPNAIPIPGRPGEFWYSMADGYAYPWGFPFLVGSRTPEEQDRATAEGLAAAINAPPRLYNVDTFSASMTISPVARYAGRARQKKLRGVDQRERPSRSRVPKHVARQSGRLDGRRGRW